MFVSSPGCSTLWAETIILGAAPKAPSVAIAPRPSAGAFSSPHQIPAGWFQLNSGLLVPPGTAGARRLQAPGARKPLATFDSAASVQSGGDLHSAASVLSSEEFSSTLESFTPSSLASSAAEDTHAAADRLHALIEGAQTERYSSPSAAVTAAYSRSKPAPVTTARPPTRVTRELHRAPANAAAPAAGSPGDRPDTWRAALMEAGIWAKSFKHYFVDLSVKNWRKFRAEPRVSENAVSDPRGFFGDTRMMGMIGGFKTIGSVSGNDDYVAAQAQDIYDRHFTHPTARSQETREAFAHYLVRAKAYNPSRRSSNLRKHIRKALLSASTLEPDALRRYFDSLMAADVNGAVAQYQTQGQYQTLAGFRQAVNATIDEEALLEPDAGKRVSAVVVLGSYASGAATPSSDFDLQVVTADGSSQRVPAFLKRLQSRWTDPGHPINGAPFGLPQSRGLLLRVHREPYVILSPDTALERNLSPPMGFYAARPAPSSGPSLMERLEWTGYRAFLNATLWLTDVKDALFKPSAPGAEAAALDDAARKKAMWGLQLQKGLGIATFFLTSIAYSILATDIVGKAGYSNLMALGTMMSIGLGAFSGMLVDRMTLRNMMLVNVAVRAANGLAIFALVTMGALNFWTMLLLALFNGWNLTSMFITEDKVISEISKGGKTGGNNALSSLISVGLSVFLTIFLGWGQIVDLAMAGLGRMQGLSAMFLIQAVMHVPVAALIVWKTIPNLKPAARKAKAEDGAAPEPGRARKWLRMGLTWGAAVAFGAYFFFAPVPALVAGLAPAWLSGMLWGSTIPFAIGMVAAVVRTTTVFPEVYANKTLRAAVGLGMLGAFIFYPWSSIYVPFIARELGGSVETVPGLISVIADWLGFSLGKQSNGGLQGILIGALMFGQMLAAATRLDLKGKGDLMVKGGVLAAAAVWLYFFLFPGSLVALGAGMAGAVVMLAATSLLTDRGWFRFAFVGLLSLWPATAYWMGWLGGTPSAAVTISLLQLAAFMLGLINAPNKVTTDTVTQMESKEKFTDRFGMVAGLKSALTTGAISMSYSLTSPLVKGTENAFPSAMLPLAILFSLAAVAFWFAPRWLGARMSKDLFKRPKWLPWWPSQAPGALGRLTLRRAYAAIAATFLGARVAAPALSQTDIMALLESRIREHGVKVVVLDYDNTLVDKNAAGKSVKAGAELLSRLDELRRRTGVRLVVSTNHFFDGDEKAMTALLADGLAPETRAGMLFVTQSGARIHRYGPGGEKPAEAEWSDTTFDDAERARITPVFERVARKHWAEYNIVHESDRTLVELNAAHESVDREQQLQAIRDALAAASAENGWEYRVDAKSMPTARGVPYVQFSRSNKGKGLRQALQMLKAAGEIDKEEQVLIIGDDHGPRGNDLFMAEAVPGALALSVGARTVAQQANLYQWPTTGENGTSQILQELLKQLERIGSRP